MLYYKYVIDMNGAELREPIEDTDADCWVSVGRVIETSEFQTLVEPIDVNNTELDVVGVFSNSNGLQLNGFISKGIPQLVFNNIQDLAVDNTVYIVMDGEDSFQSFYKVVGKEIKAKIDSKYAGLIGWEYSDFVSSVGHIWNYGIKDEDLLGEKWTMLPTDIDSILKLRHSADYSKMKAVLTDYINEMYYKENEPTIFSSDVVQLDLSTYFFTVTSSTPAQEDRFSPSSSIETDAEYVAFASQSFYKLTGDLKQAGSTFLQALDVTSAERYTISPVSNPTYKTDIYAFYGAKRSVPLSTSAALKDIYGENGYKTDYPGFSDNFDIMSKFTPIEGIIAIPKSGDTTYE